MEKYFLLSVILFFSLKMSAQPFSNSKYVPASPNAASLGTYGYFDNSLYTGSLGLSIPLYSINLDGKDFPINLSYHSNGTKVAQEASWVGLGWVLNVGGAIVKDTRGLDDFRDGGFWRNSNKPWDIESEEMGYISISHPDTLEEYLSYANSIKDTQPDIFYFNCGNLSGTMLFGEKKKSSIDNNTAKPIFNSSESPLDVTYDIKFKRWIIRDGQGYTYYFGSAEETVLYTEQFETYQGEIGDRSMNRVDIPTITSWLLDSIKSPNNNGIYFQYEKEMIRTPIQMREECAVLSEIHRNGGGNDLRSPISAYNYSYGEINQLVLKSINFGGGSIKFETSDRLDLKCLNPYGESKMAQKLSSFNVYDLYNNKIKQILFNYHYLGEKNSNGRLLLESITEYSENNKPKHEFTYNESRYLPPKHSIRTDAWGYFNNSMISNDINVSKAIPTIFEGGKTIRLGADKSFNREFASIGILETIKYPTGGSSKFIYEANKFGSQVVLKTNTFMDGFIDNYNVDADKYIMNRRIVSDVFEITNENIIDMRILSGFDNPFRDSKEPENPSVFYSMELEKWDGVEFNTIVLSDEVKIDNTRSNTYIIPFQKLKRPLVGKYRLVIRSVRCIDLMIETYVFARLQYKAKVYENEEQEGGGLRIAEVRNTPSEKGKTEIKKYNYSDAISMQDFHNNFRVNVYSPAEHTATFDVTYHVGSSNNYTPFLGLGKSEIGYSQVTELSNEGSTIYNYNNIKPIKTISPGMLTTPHFTNGLLSSIEIRDKQNIIKKKEEYVYSKVKQEIIAGLNVLRLDIIKLLPASHNFSLNPIRLENWRMVQKKTTVYNEGDMEILETSLYGYDSFFQRNRITTYDSKGNEMIESTKYANGNSDNISKKMTNKYMISVPIERIVFINKNVIKANKTIYKDTLNLILPFQEYSFASNQAKPLNSYSNYYELKMIYNKYNIKGKLLETIDSKNNYSALIWDRNNIYPIAIVNNCNHNIASNVIGSYNTDGITPPDQQKELSIRSSLYMKVPNASINTYSYKPLVGVTSITNPSGITTYYEYDIFNRLWRTKDQKGNIINEYHYNYQNQ